MLTSEAPQLDLQAAGGLYDAITLQIFPDPIANVIRNALPVLTADKFCDAIGRERHLRGSLNGRKHLSCSQLTRM